MAAAWIGRLAVTGLIALAGVYAHHVMQLFEGEPAGGCGTAVVPAAVLDVCSSQREGMTPLPAP